jgi:hypothetical protein
MKQKYEPEDEVGGVRILNKRSDGSYRGRYLCCGKICVISQRTLARKVAEESEGMEVMCGECAADFNPRPRVSYVGSWPSIQFSKEEKKRKMEPKGTWGRSNSSRREY